MVWAIPGWLAAGVPALQPRGCTQAFCPPRFGVRQAQVVLGIFPCEVWCGIPPWLVSAAVATACSARKTRSLANPSVQQSEGGMRCEAMAAQDQLHGQSGPVLHG